MQYAFVLTSCGRFDLLDATLASFVAHAEIPPTQVIISEDSGDADVRDVVTRHFPQAEIFVNQPRLGQIRSIDQAYASVATEWVFHCEDDWEFYRPGFIGESMKLLQSFSDVSMVGLRPRSEHNPRMREMPVTVHEGVRFHHFDPTRHPEYFSYSFNPGLRRLSDYRAIGPFADIGPEEHVSYAFKKAGFHIANLEEPAVRHIGDGRHVDSPGSRRPTTTLGRWQRSLEKRILRFNRWRAGQ